MNEADEKKYRDAWGSELCDTISKEVMALLYAEEKKYGVAFSESVGITIIARLVSTLYFNALTPTAEQEKLSDVELEKIVSTRANTMKLALQDSIAAGFAGAMEMFSGRSIEYYCQVKPVPEPKSYKAS